MERVRSEDVSRRWGAGGNAAAEGHDRHDLETRRSCIRHQAYERGLVGNDKLTCPVPCPLTAESVRYQGLGVKRVCVQSVRRSFRMCQSEKDGDQK